MKAKLTISYDGSKFEGFQRQKEKVTVQGKMEEVLSEVFNSDIKVKGAGRTDAGVHANGQVIHFEHDAIPTDLVTKLNDKLPNYLRVKEMQFVDEKFHARKSAKKKRYVYKIYLGKYKIALRDYVFEPNYKIDLSLMKEASKCMLGTHDFRNFVSGYREDYVTTITAIKFHKLFDTVTIVFEGTGFYRYMIRNLVGALLEVGKLRISDATIKEMIENYTVRKVLPTAPAEGLYLDKIWY